MDDYPLLWSFGILAAMVAGFYVYENPRGLMNLIKRRAAGVICVGLAILAAGVFLRRSDAVGYQYEDWFDDGYVALLGAAVGLIGLYYWLMASIDTKE